MSITNLQNYSIPCIDIGGRGGPDESLRPIAEMVHWTVVEPDPDECERISRAGDHGFASVRTVSTAIGNTSPPPAMHTSTREADLQETASRKLRLYRQRGCSSLYEADASCAARYDRDGYYILDGEVDVQLQGLDEALYREDKDYSYLKIDIQGAELEAFMTGPQLLSQLVMVRCEVSFLPIYKRQPLFADISAFMTESGFELLRFVEQHHWRRNSRTKYPRVAGNGVSSVGQLIHGDALFVRSPESLIRSSPKAGKKLLDLAFLAYAYGDVDLAIAALNTNEAVSAFEAFRENQNETITELTEWMVTSARHRQRKGRLKAYVRELLEYLRGIRV